MEKVDLKNSNVIKVISKSISVDGRNLIVDLVRMGKDEGMLLKEVASLFDISEKTTSFGR